MNSTRRPAQTALLAIAAGLAHSVQAASFSVSNNADAGAGSLRAAITAANAAGAAAMPHRILFGPPYANGATITLSSSLPVITVPIEFEGNGYDPVLNGSEQFPLLRTTSTQLNVRKMTFTNGWTPAEDSINGNGGCIQYLGPASTAANLIVVDAVFDNCRARNLRFASGGAIDWPSREGFLIVGRSVFLDNAAISNSPSAEQPRGGAIATNGILRVSRSEFIGNSVSGAGVRGGFGGAIASFVQAENAMEVDESRFHGNSVTPNADTFGEGGAIYVSIGSDAFARLRRNWFRANTARIGGSVSATGQTSAELFVRNTTFHEGLAVQSGGGLSASTIVTDLAEMTFARNVAMQGAGPHLDLDAVTLRRFSNVAMAAALTSGDPCRLSAVTSSQTIRAGNVFTIGCAGLESTGSVMFPTPPTFAVDESQTVGVLIFPQGSPVIDGGDNTVDSCSELDARGTIRPLDGDSDGQARCDAGAVEHVSPILFRNGFE